ncbi:MAG TPA: DUF3078 domain-containing protein [Ohtaekwangia sp.]|nr:DUF3078 domain-containing protein [Ohtaekwangia sp.]
MKKFGFLIVALSLTLLAAQAQIVRVDSLSPWKKKLVANLNLNQASFSSNWKAGGINSIGINSLFNYKANYVADKISWDNEIDLAYGFVNNTGQGYRKTIDRIFLDTKYGRKLNDKWSLFTSLNFLSQFTKGYNYEEDANGDEQALLISDFIAPAFVTSAWGVEYVPAEYFKLRISPFAPRLTIVKDARRFTETVGPEPYGVDSTETTRFEWLAFQLMADFNKDIATNVNLKWRYMMYANYETIKMKTIDHRLDLNIGVKLGRFVNMGIGGILIYDYDQDSGAQVSQVFSIGVAYNFQNYVEEK